jgi:hypothetical protein
MLEIHHKPLKNNALHLKSHPLLEPLGAGEENLPAGSQYTVPRHFGTAIPERPDNLTGASGKSGGFGHLTIGGNAAALNAAHHRSNLAQHRLFMLE